MKLTMLILAAFAFVIPAYADENPDDSGHLLNAMVQCQAIDLSLMQLHNQLAASIDSLSPNPPHQLALLRDSYRAMSQTEMAQFQEMAKLTTQALPKDSEQQYRAAQKQAIEAVQTVLGFIDYDTQVKAQSKLLEGARWCEALVGHLNKDSTF